MPFMISKVMSLLLVNDQQLYGIRDIALGRQLAMDDLCRIADYDRVRRDVKVHKRKGSDKDIVSDRDITYDTGVAPDPHIVANYRIPFPFTSKLHPDGDSVIHRTVFSEDGFVVYGYVSTMNQDESLADPGVPTDLYPSFQ